jgi:uncharacterized membrane protein
MRSWLWSRALLTIAMVLPVAMCLGLLAIRARATGQLRFAFLVWNLFLAVLPFPVALLTDYVSRLKRWQFAIPLAGLWLLLLPNSPYLITDLVHLGRSDVPYWFDTLLYGSFAVTGVMLGFGSVALIHTATRDRFGRPQGWAVALSSLVLSAFGIYLGRIERWNSWNVIGDPVALGRSILSPIRSPLANARTVGFVLLYSAFLVITYVGMSMIGVLLSNTTAPFTPKRQEPPTP